MYGAEYLSDWKLASDQIQSLLKTIETKQLMSLSTEELVENMEGSLIPCSPDSSSDRSLLVRSGTKIKKKEGTATKSEPCGR
jgi:hypothetical protein